MIVSYAWSFGDGNTGSGAQPTHSYTAAGNYTVGLCVVDDDSAQTCCQTTALISPCASCPPSSQIEGEPRCVDGYVDTSNGGCNSTPPVFSVASCHTICGETGTYFFDGQQHSDTDWYRITVGPGSFSYSGIALGFVLRLSVLRNQCPTVILSTITSPSCEQSARSSSTDREPSSCSPARTTSSVSPAPRCTSCPSPAPESRPAI